MDSLEKLSATDWWKLARKMPSVAGAWEVYETDNQRVSTMRVRRNIRGLESVVMVYGPHVHVSEAGSGERRWWIAAFSGPLSYLGCAQGTNGGFHESIEAAQQAADNLLVKNGWLLVGSSP
jgi:hypothetical protein